eukprot:gb/GECG01008415.1/.p1 GENE.gb/GECG01008415.1/~~gb/GECG01008415.1/.p1  ORF type:complete len:242 (+),score=26.02 gb/GECG01008415.1/:1-726(+)
MLIRGVRKSSFRLIKSRGGNKNLELQLQQTPPLWFIQATDSTLRSCSRRWTSTTPSSKRTTATAATATVEEEKLVPEEKETHAEKPQKLSLKQIVQLYGKSAIGIYAALYFAPLIGGYYLFRATNNFGLDPISMLDYVGMREKAFKMMNADPEDGISGLKPWQVSFVLSYVANQFVELVRLPATIALAPKVHRMMNKPKVEPKEAPSPDPDAVVGKQKNEKDETTQTSDKSTATHTSDRQK